MGNITIGDRAVESFSDQEMADWINDVKEGYKIRNNTLDLWVAIMRVFDDVGIPVTVRQMFYRLVSDGVIGKRERVQKDCQAIGKHAQGWCCSVRFYCGQHPVDAEA